ncbi:MAG: PAS domain S-box protein [Hyphomicrobiaceae bacterium]
MLAAAALGMRLQQDGIGVFWLAAGVGAGMMALASSRHDRLAVSLGILAAIAIASSIRSVSLVTSIIFTLGNLIQASLFVFSARLLPEGRFELTRLNGVLAFLGMALLAPAIVAILMGLCLKLSSGVTGTFAEAWWLWFSSHSVGILTVAPIVMLVGFTPRLRDVFASDDLALAAVVGIAAIVVIGLVFPTTSVAMLLMLVLLVPLAWWVIRRASPHRAAVAVLIIAVVTFWLTGEGAGLFGTGIISAQLFLGVTASALLLAGAWRAERGEDATSDAEVLLEIKDLKSIAVLVPLTLFAIVAWWIWRGVEAEATARVERTTTSLSEHAQRIVEVQIGLLEAALAHAKSNSMEQIAADRRVHDFLHYLSSWSETIEAMALVDPHTGKILASDQRFPPPQANLSGRDYFSAHQNHQLSVVIGSAVRTPFTHRVGFTVSRRDPDTGLIAVSMVAVKEFAEFFQGMISSPRDAIALIRNDGALLASIPPPDEPIGGQLPAESGFMALARNNPAVPVTVDGQGDGIARLAFSRRVASYPLQVIYAADIATLRSQWLAQLVPFGILALFASAGLRWLAGRMQSASAEAEAARAEAFVQTRLAEASRKSDELTREHSRVTARLAAIVTYSTDAILSKTLDGTITSWNAAAGQMFGYTEQEMIGQSIRRLVPDDRQREEDEILARIAAGEVITNLETVRVRKGGREIEVAVTVSPMRDRNGTIIGASKILRDISARSRAERALAESEERFRMLADNMSQFAWMADEEGSIFWYNKRWYDYTGTTLDEMQGWGWRKVHHPDHVDRVVESLQHAWDTGEPWEETFPLRSAEGEYRWFLSRALPIRDERGRIVRWFGTNTDVTDLREAEAALRDSEERFRGIFQHAATGISISDLGGLFLSCNPAYSEILGYDQDEIRRLTYTDLVHPDDREENVRQVRRLREGEIDSFVVTNRSVRKDGQTVWLQKHVSVLRDASGRPTNHIALITNMTDRKRAEERQHLMMRELAHRGKNLLAVIQSIATRSLSGELTLEQGRTAFLGRLQALARTYSNLTDEAFEGALLDEIVAGELKSFPGRVLLEGQRVMLTAKAAQTFALVVHELATNAAKYGSLSVDSGRLEVRWSVVSIADEQRLRFAWIEQGGPAAVEPSRRGFGTILITNVAGAEFGCQPGLEYTPHGFRYRLDAVLDRVGALVEASPVRNRIRSVRLRQLYDAWIKHRGDAAEPPLYDGFGKETGVDLDALTIVDVDEAGDLKFVEVGRPVGERMNRSIVDTPLAREDLDTILVAFRHCSTSTEPCHEILRFDLGRDEKVTFERLIVPFSGATARRRRLVGLAVFSGTADEIASPIDPQART